MTSEIDKAVEIIRNGGVILYPTDTVWGLGCDPKNDEAIDKINRIKKRADSKSFLLLVDGLPLLHRYVKEVPEVCYDLIEFADKPLTIVYPEGQYVSPKVLGPDGSIAIRKTNDPFCSKLMQKLKSGIVSTSANISGEDSPNKIEEVVDEIKEQVDYIVNLPSKGLNKPSQIIKIGPKGEIEILRK